MVASATDESFPLDLFSYTIFVASALIFYVHFSTNVIASIINCVVNTYTTDATISIGV